MAPSIADGCAVDATVLPELTFSAPKTSQPERGALGMAWKGRFDVAAIDVVLVGYRY